MYSDFQKFLNQMGDDLLFFKETGVFKSFVEEIFTERFFFETKDLRSELLSHPNRSFYSKSAQSFPEFLYHLLCLKQKTQAAGEQVTYFLITSGKILKQMVINFLNTLEFFKSELTGASILSRFATEFFDRNDLTFFLFLRFFVEKHTKLPLFCSKNWLVIKG